METYVYFWINLKLMWTSTLKWGSNTSPNLDNVDPPHLHISTMWSFNTYTYDNLSYTLSQINTIFSLYLKAVVTLCTLYCSYHIWLVDKIILASFETNFD